MRLRDGSRLDRSAATSGEPLVVGGLGWRCLVAATIPSGSLASGRSPAIFLPEQLIAQNPPSIDPVRIHVHGKAPCDRSPRQVRPDRRTGSVQSRSSWDRDPSHGSRRSSSPTESAILMPASKVLNRSEWDRISWIRVHHLFPENFTFYLL